MKCREGTGLGVWNIQLGFVSDLDKNPGILSPQRFSSQSYELLK